MSGARGGACCLLVGVTGCLAAPPDAPGECAPLVRNAFDDPGLWQPYSEPGSAVTPAADAVLLSATPTAQQERTFADLHSAGEMALRDSQLGATLLVTGDLGSAAGISWNHDVEPGYDENDFYDITVDGDRLHAMRKEAFADEGSLCWPDCPIYDPALHAHVRLRAVADEVLYEYSGDGSEWSELARAPLVDGLYRVVAFVFAAAPSARELEVTEMTWAACEP